MNMLKKAGIIVAAAATGVLAVSGLAFADTTSGNLGNDCAFGNASGDASQIQDGGSNLVSILTGIIGATTNAATQANVGNCTNLNVTDVLDNDSNNSTKTVDATEIDDSFNTQAQHHHHR
jgi:hypothetical protein